MAIRDPERYFDRRTKKRHLKRGHATEEDYQAYLASLPDLADNIMDRDEGGDEDGYEERVAAALEDDDEDATAEGEAPAADAPAPAPAPAPAEAPAPAPIGDPGIPS